MSLGVCVCACVCLCEGHSESVLCILCVRVNVRRGEHKLFVTLLPHFTRM